MNCIRRQWSWHTVDPRFDQPNARKIHALQKMGEKKYLLGHWYTRASHVYTQHTRCTLLGLGDTTPTNDRMCVYVSMLMLATHAPRDLTLYPPNSRGFLPALPYATSSVGRPPLPSFCVSPPRPAPSTCMFSVYAPRRHSWPSSASLRDFRILATRFRIVYVPFRFRAQHFRISSV